MRLRDLPVEGWDAADDRDTLGFLVDAVDELVPMVLEVGAEIVEPPHNSEWGRRAVVRDLDGHAVELTTPGP
jgi:predicted lactoylglutathione lyase